MKQKDKIFKNLGYEKIKIDSHIVYNNSDNFISFCIERKIVHLANTLDNSFNMTMEELKCINNKCKEMGWIE